jgi:hypothetical protein
MRQSARRILGTIVVLAAGVAVPAIADLASHRAATPPQLSLNVELPVFQVTGLIPGDSMTRCVRVRNEGDDPIAMIDGATVDGELAQYLRVSIEKGTGLGDTGPLCAGFRSAGYGYGTTAAGVAPDALQPDYTTSLAGHGEKSLRVIVAMPASTPIAAAAKQGTITLAFAGYPIATSTTPTTTPTLPGGIAPGTDGGYDKNGNFLTNSQIKKRLRIGKARLLSNGDIVVKMFLPAGGAIRAKAIMTNGVYYAHTLLPVEWGPTVRVLLKRRAVGRDAVAKHRRSHRAFALRITTRYRWAHGPNAFVQPEQKLTVLRGR